MPRQDTKVRLSQSFERSHHLLPYTSLRAEVNELANLYMAARHLNSTKGQTFKNSGRICCMCERPPGELVIVGRFSEATKIEIYTTLTFVVF
jgi:hypothetical protein